MADSDLLGGEAQTGGRPLGEGWRPILRRLVSVWWPILMSTIARNVTGMVVLGLVGKHSGGTGSNSSSTMDVAAVGLGSVFTNVLGYCVLFGLAAGIDTLSTQAFGRNDFLQMGNVLGTHFWS